MLIAKAQANRQEKDEHKGREYDIQGTPLISQPGDVSLKLTLTLLTSPPTIA